MDSVYIKASPTSLIAWGGEWRRKLALRPGCLLCILGLLQVTLYQSERSWICCSSKGVVEVPLALLGSVELLTKLAASSCESMSSMMSSR